MKTPVIILIVVLVLGTVGGIWYSVNRKAPETENTNAVTNGNTANLNAANQNTNSATVTNTLNTNTTVASNANTNTEATPATPANKQMIFATKEGTEVTVWSRNTTTGEQVSLFTYTEQRNAELSSNYWEERPPSIALSSDASTFAFIPEKSISIRNRLNGEQRDLVTQVRPADGLEGSPTWSHESITGYGFANPGWSSDGEHINFSHIGYEGGDYGILNIHTLGYSTPTIITDSFDHNESGIGGGTHRFTWSADGDGYVVANGGAFEVPGLYSPTNPATDLSHVVNIADVLGTNQKFFDVDVDGSSVFTYGTAQSLDASAALTHIATDGTMTTIPTEGTPTVPQLNSRASVVYFVDTTESGSSLKRYSLTAGTTTTLATLPEEWATWEKTPWAPRDYLLLVGRSHATNTSTLLALSTTDGSVLYQHPTETYFATYLGIVD